MKNKSFIQKIKLRNKYATNKREPFYALAGEYLPENKDAVIADIGSGYGYFAEYLRLRDRYKNIFLLDADPNTVRRTKNAVFYRAPGKLPFKDGSVDFIHCSHLIEHLPTDEFFVFLREMDRVLAKNGVLAISAPLLNGRFYEGLAHIRPYGPEGIVNYMCAESEKAKKKAIAAADGGAISEKYKVEELVYRYARDSGDSEWGSKYLLVSVLMKIAKKALALLGFRKYEKNGFTLILRKYE